MYNTDWSVQIVLINFIINAKSKTILPYHLFNSCFNWKIIFKHYVYKILATIFDVYQNKSITY